MLFKNYEMGLKTRFHIKLIWISIIARNILGFIGLFAYPFINKSKARKHRNFWWLMLNDDELDNPDNNGKDYDVKMIKRKGVPKWFASYWFNALRNRAYNWLQYKYYPVLDVDRYRLVEGTPEAMEWKGGAAWFHPNDNTDVLSLRYSRYFNIFYLTLKIEYGDFGDRYDFNIKRV